VRLLTRDKETAVRRLDGRIALITGGTSGIGLATAKLFRSEGATVAIIGRDPTRMQQASEAIGDGVLPITADVSRPAEIVSAMERVKESFGHLDIVFANAGFSHCPPLADTTEAFFDDIFGTNVKSAFFTFLAALPLLSNGASVIFTSSATHERGRPGDPLYLATKAALRSLARTLAADDAVLERKIRINTVSPGPIHTPLTADLVADPDIDAWVRGQVPMARWGEAEEVARAALFLASSDASYTTGADLAVDGGLGQI
jgi:NAD(P)-dependent dehydrogenase (short-subunit alcohol dehydrogenase family)